MEKSTWVTLAVLFLSVGAGVGCLLPDLALPVGAGLALVFGLFYFYVTHWTESQVNEWLMVISDGKMTKAGVGLKTYVSPNDTVVKFPASLNTLYFSANNITKEVQGIQISGFAIWNVFRDGDGPFRYYKYSQGGNANENIKIVCESIVRDHIANSSLKDVLFNRNVMREKMRTELQKQVNGWGVWLQTIEIQSVMISSNNYFKDLQSRFRLDLHNKAETIRNATEYKINKLKSDIGLKRNDLDNEFRTKRLELEKTEANKKEVKKLDFDIKMSEFEIQRLKLSEQIEVAEQDMNTFISNLELRNQREVTTLENELRSQLQTKLVAERNKVGKENIKLKRIEIMENIYKKLPIQSLETLAYSSDKIVDARSLIPGLDRIYA